MDDDGIFIEDQIDWESEYAFTRTVRKFYFYWLCSTW